MSDLKLAGTIKEIMPVEKGTSKAGKSWTKQSFVLDTNAEFNNIVCFNLFGDKKIEAFSKFKVNQVVEVFFNVSSREYNGNYYHNLDAWKLEVIETGEQIAPEEEDDLGF